MQTKYIKINNKISYDSTHRMNPSCEKTEFVVVQNKKHKNNIFDIIFKIIT